MDASVIGELAAECPETVTAGRLHHIRAALSDVLRSGVRGAVVELGCYKGVTSQFLQMVIDECDPDRELHVYDSFRGLPEPGTRDGDGALRGGDLAATSRNLSEGFRRRALRQPIVHAGWFEDTLPIALPPEICFAYLDADFEAPTATALRYVYPKISPDGVLLVDDYCDKQRNRHCWDGLPGVRIAVDRFLADKTEEIQILPGPGDLSLAIIRRHGDRADAH
jgi:O-methyltransferase